MVRHVGSQWSVLRTGLSGGFYLQSPCSSTAAILGDISESNPTVQLSIARPVALLLFSSKEATLNNTYVFTVFLLVLLLCLFVALVFLSSLLSSLPFFPRPFKYLN